MCVYKSFERIYIEQLRTGIHKLFLPDLTGIVGLDSHPSMKSEMVQWIDYKHLKKKKDKNDMLNNINIILTAVLQQDFS